MATTSWTTLGTIGGTASARVDHAGRISAADGSWRFDWSIGAEDRWHDPASTANVRQTCLSDVPVVETRMRVPGGDIIHRSFALHVAGADGGSEWIVVEVENDSAVPVALAVGDPSPAKLVVPRAPSDTRGERELVFTLTHRATIRFLVSLAGEVETDPVAADLPPVDAVISGWRTQLDRGATFFGPDERIQQAIQTTRAHLLVDASRSISPKLAVTLDDFGLHGDARGVVARLVEFRFDTRRGSFGDLASNTAIVAAIARHQRLAPDPEFAATVVDRFVAGLQQLLDSIRPRRFRPRPQAPDPEVVAALVDAVPFLEAAGETDAAATVRAALVDLEPAVGPSAPGDVDPVAVVDEMVASASTTWTWPTADGLDRSVGESIRFLDHVRRSFVDEHADRVTLLPRVPQRWLGQSLEVHDVPTRHGSCAFAVRWHGARPALLWEIDVTATSDPVTITCGLDPTWSTTEPSGEALLEAPAAPTGAVEGPGDGESFG